jgi:Pyruvate/2-oxoacid:ferredoxin oxidoreductase delta subunit
MAETIYDQLGAALNSRNMNLPAIKCDAYYALVEFLFTPEEAAVICSMPIAYASVEEVAANLGSSDIGKLSDMLETMGDKGLIHIKEINGKKLYEALPFVPGILEFQLLRGIVDEKHKQAARLILNYYKALNNVAVLSTPPLEATFAGRKLTVNKDIKGNTSTIIPYHEMKALIENTEYIAAGTCVCRHMGNLLGKPSHKPINNCMIFGESASFSVGRNFTKRLTKEECYKILEDAEEAGLIHTYSNRPDQFTNLLCNCCREHCNAMKAIRRFPVPGQVITTRYLVNIDEDACTACEACLPRCQMDALKIVDGKLTGDADRCIGCGLCMYVCLADALHLEPTESGRVPLKKC